MKKNSDFSQIKLGQTANSTILQHGLVNTLHWLWQALGAPSGTIRELNDWKTREIQLFPNLGISNLVFLLI